MPTPLPIPSAQDRSSGTFVVFDQQSGQQVPVSLGATYSKGGLQSTAAHAMPVHVSTSPPAPGENTGYEVFNATAEERSTAATMPAAHFILLRTLWGWTCEA